MACAHIQHAGIAHHDEILILHIGGCQQFGGKFGADAARISDGECNAHECESSI